MSEPDKDDPKAAEEARARLERVRSLLFGAQIEAWDARVGALEDQVIGSAESLRQEVEADLEALGTRLDERLRRIEGEIESFASLSERLEARLAAAPADGSEGPVAAAPELGSAVARLERRVEALESAEPPPSVIPRVERLEARLAAVGPRLEQLARAQETLREITGARQAPPDRKIDALEAQVAALAARLEDLGAAAEEAKAQRGAMGAAHDELAAAVEAMRRAAAEMRERQDALEARAAPAADPPPASERAPAPTATWSGELQELRAMLHLELKQLDAHASAARRALAMRMDDQVRRVREELRGLLLELHRRFEAMSDRATQAGAADPELRRAGRAGLAAMLRELAEAIEGSE